MNPQRLHGLPWLAVLVLAASSSHACEHATAGDAVRSYFLESFSPKCIEYRDEYSYDERWLESCKRLNLPSHRHLHEGLAERTTITAVRTISRGSRTFGVIEYAGPDHFEFQLRLSRVGLCLGEHDKLDADWPIAEGTAATQTGCGDEFWTDMPIRAKRGGVELVCHEGDWRIYLPDPRTTKGISLDVDFDSDEPAR